jgi:co-chaperonin GroES (HSP10)
MLRALGRNLLVKIKPQEKKSSLILNVTIKDEPFEVVLVNKGGGVELEVEPGETLLIVPYAGSKINKTDEEHLLVTERDILGVVE